jgi:hypothetical protein
LYDSGYKLFSKIINARLETTATASALEEQQPLKREVCHRQCIYFATINETKRSTFSLQTHLALKMFVFQVAAQYRLV